MWHKKFLSALAIFACMALGACQNDTHPNGVVAVVNGEPINLRTIQAMIDTRQASDPHMPRPSLKEMRQNYAHATSLLIIAALVRQDLAQRNMEFNESEFKENIERIKADLGEENWEAYLTDTALHEDEWVLLMRDNFAIDTFMKKVIIPGIRIPLDEIRDYYEVHKKEFEKPVLYGVCYGATDKKEILKTWCSSKDKREPVDGASIHCISATYDNIPSPWREEIRKINKQTCGTIVSQDGQWRSVAIIEKDEAASLPLSTIYPLIENILLEEKKNNAFQEWLQKQFSKAKIIASQELFPKSDF